MRTTKGKKEKCIHCGRDYVTGYITTHWRKDHGIYGGRSGRPKNGQNIEIINPVQQVNHNRALAFKLMPYVVLEDQNGGVWVAEKIRG